MNPKHPTRPTLSGAAHSALERVRELHWTCQLQAVVDESAAALAGKTPFTDTQRAELLELRIDALLYQGELARAEVDVQALEALARQRRGNAEVQAWALRRRSIMQGRAGSADESLDTARQSHAAAVRSGDAMLLALCEQALSQARVRARQDMPQAFELAGSAAAGFHALGQTALQGRALRDQAAAAQSMGQAAESDRLCHQALQMARACGDLIAQGNALNLLTFHEPDQAAQLKLYRQAREAFEAAGNTGGLAMIGGNLGQTYAELGLFRRARRQLRDAEAVQLAQNNRQALVVSGWALAEIELRLRRVGSGGLVAAAPGPRGRSGAAARARLQGLRCHGHRQPAGLPAASGAGLARCGPAQARAGRDAARDRAAPRQRPGQA